jgi:hypothetical protein
MKTFDKTEKLIFTIKFRLLSFCAYKLKRSSIIKS